jgi:hypothetical protein
VWIFGYVYERTLHSARISDCYILTFFVSQSNCLLLQLCYSVRIVARANMVDIGTVARHFGESARTPAVDW